MVPAVILHLGEQPPMPSLLVSHNRSGHDCTDTRGECLWRTSSRALSLLCRKLRYLRALPALRRCVATAANPQRPRRRVGQLLQHALPCIGRPCPMGLECRGPCVDRGLLGPAEAMDPCGCLRGSLGQPATLHPRLGEEDVVLRGLFYRRCHRRDSTICA